MSRKLWYELFSVIYVVHKLLLIHSFTAVIFLKQELPSSIVPIQMPDHGWVRLALGHNMMFMSTDSIPLGGEKILIHGWSQIMKARPSWRIGQKIMFRRLWMHGVVHGPCLGAWRPHPWLTVGKVALFEACFVRLNLYKYSYCFQLWLLSAPASFS